MLSSQGHFRVGGPMSSMDGGSRLGTSSIGQNPRDKSFDVQDSEVRPKTQGKFRSPHKSTMRILFNPDLDFDLSPGKNKSPPNELVRKRRTMTMVGEKEDGMLLPRHCSFNSRNSNMRYHNTHKPTTTMLNVEEMDPSPSKRTNRSP